MSWSWKGQADTRWQRFRAALIRQWAGEGRTQCEVGGPKCNGRVQQVDHIVMLSMGGEKYDPLNCRPSCQPCNGGRRVDVEPEPPHRIVSSW